ncbi:MAG: hypothetical protein KGQ59_07255, partial [Bdellovibrionales bacterium]|nr:hypothetical protein [Bdellovibrionales bacterium]
YTDYVTDQRGNRQIYTFYELTPSEVFKGSLADSGRVIIRELGGSKNGVRMSIPGSANFKRGEEVIIFLGNSNSDGSHTVRGMMMGKFWIESFKGEEYVVGPGALAPDEIQEGAITHSDESHSTPDRSRYTLKALRALVRNESPSPAISPSKISTVPPQLSQTSSAVAENPLLPSPSPSAPIDEPPPAAAPGSSRWIWAVLLLVSWWAVRRLRKHPRV